MERAESETQEETTATYETMQLQINGRITGISISKNAKTLTIVSQEEVLLDLR